MSTVIGALLPLILTLAFGYFAGWRHQFSADQASTMNKLVLLYAVPLLLFTGTVTIERHQLTADLGLAAGIAVAMLAAYTLTYLITRFLIKRSHGVSALTALVVGGPAIPFAGIVVLGYLYGAKASAVPVAIGSLVLNVIEVPFTLLMLTLDAASATLADVPAPRVMIEAQNPAHQPTVEPVMAMAAADGRASVHAGAGAQQPTPATEMGSTGSSHEKVPAGAGQVSVAENLISTAKQPIVWAPILALVLVLVGLSLPQPLVHAMALLGSASTGIALFASGIVLYAQRVAVTRFVVGSVAARNVIVPAVLWAILAALGMPHTDLRLAVLALALPAPVAVVLFAVRYNQGQREMASMVLFSSVGSLVTLAAFIALT
jgi:malonate transporter